MKKFETIMLITALLFTAITVQAQEILEAVKRNDHSRVKGIIQADPQSVNCNDNRNCTPLHYAADRGDLEITNLLISNGADLLARDTDGDTPLHWAAFKGNSEIVNLLLEKGAEPSPMNKNGDTPLNYAIADRSMETIDLLLDNGAEYDRTGIKALYMLQKSAKTGLERFFKVIVEREGYSLFVDKERNRWTLQDAISGGSIELVKILLEKNIPLEKNGDIYGWTPIHYAASKNRLPMLEFLVKKGIDINKRTKSGETAYNLAEKEGNKEAQELIVKLGGKIDPVKFPSIKGSYLGQNPPGMKPEIFAPGIISRPDLKEFTSTFSPDGKELFFYGFRPNFHSKIYVSRIVNDTWSAPEEFSITSAYSATLPFIPSDNKRLFFNWNNPQFNGPWSIWVTERTVGGWSEPEYTGSGFYMSETKDGQIYISDVSSQDTDGRTYISKVTITNNRFTDFEKIIFPDQSGDRAHPCIAPDGSFIIFDEGDGDHIQISFRKKDGTWGRAIDLTQNSFEPLAGAPTISPDGKYLFFKQGCRGLLDIAYSDTNRDIYWVSAKIIEELRPKELK